jgi:thiamine transporter
MGGSVTLFSMFFVTLIGYWYGPAVGLMAGVAYGLLQMILDPYIVSIPQMLIDYPFAFGALGLAGFFSEKKNGMIIGYIVSVLGRFVFSVLSGVIFFGMYAPEGMSPLVYAIVYNGSYLATEAAITIILLCVPAVRKALATVKTQALN